MTRPAAAQFWPVLIVTSSGIFSLRVAVLAHVRGLVLILSTLARQTMSGVPATTVFGAGDLQGLVSHLNPWTPQIECTLSELCGAQLVMSWQLRRFVESADIELMKVTRAAKTNEKQKNKKT